MVTNLHGMNPLLSWFEQMLEFYEKDEIKIPEKYRDKVLAVKNLLNDDTSGLVGTVLGMCEEAALVKYVVETDNSNFTTFLNNWLGTINSDLRGLIPTGIDSLAKEYFRERWQGSSVLVLRTIWEEVDGWELPTSLWFVDGEDVVIKSNSKPEEGVRLDKISYELRVNKKKSVPLPIEDNEKIFVQKPYASWSNIEPIPFIIRRGLYRNLRLLKILENRGEKVLAKALEYLMLIKKGAPELFKEGVTYGRQELTDIKSDLQKFVDDKSKGIAAYATQYDTNIEHLIPDYSKILSHSLYEAIERRLLSGLGMIDIVQGVSSTRRESTLNPKPLIANVEQGIKDFTKLIMDIMQEILERNKDKHSKFTGRIVRVTNTPVKIFIDDKLRTMWRSQYDRGLISKETFAEWVGDLNFNVELKRRREEKKKVDKDLYPPIVQNLEQYAEAEDVPSDKKGIEKLNFVKSIILEEVNCPNCDIEFNFESQQELMVGIVECPDCQTPINKKDLIMAMDDITNDDIVFEEAPYKTNILLPKNIKGLPKGAQSIWRRVFNDSYPKGEDYARRVAWTAVKNAYTKKGDKWVKKSST